jgi:tetratricopeptide (TPR) repeat protein
MEHMRQAAQIAHKICDRDGELFFRSNLGMWMLLKGRIREIENMLPGLEELKDSLPNVGAGILGFEQLYNTWLTCKGDFNQALEIAQNSREKVRLLGDLQRLESILVIITLVSIITGDLDPANSAGEELVQLAEKEAASKAQAFGISSIIFSRSGEIALARTRYQQASEDFENPEKGVFDRQYIYWAEVELFLAEHKWGQAWEAFENLHAFLEHEDFPWHANLHLTMWGFALLEHGERHQKARAKRLLTEASENFKAMGAGGFVDLIASKLADDG